MTDFPQTGAKRLADFLGVSPPQYVDRPSPGSGAARLADLLNPPPPPLPPQRQAFEDHVERVIQIRGLPRPEAERATYEIVLVELLDVTHPNTLPDRCAHCGKPETPDATLVGWGERHAWLHSACIASWRALRRAKAEDDLGRLGVARPAP
jgi:hypothetical protein